MSPYVLFPARIVSRFDLTVIRIAQPVGSTGRGFPVNPYGAVQPAVPAADAGPVAPPPGAKRLGGRRSPTGTRALQHRSRSPYGGFENGPGIGAGTGGNVPMITAAGRGRRGRPAPGRPAIPAAGSSASSAAGRSGAGRSGAGRSGAGRSGAGRSGAGRSGAGRSGPVRSGVRSGGRAPRRPPRRPGHGRAPPGRSGAYARPAWPPSTRQLRFGRTLPARRWVTAEPEASSLRSMRRCGSAGRRSGRAPIGSRPDPPPRRGPPGQLRQPDEEQPARPANAAGQSDGSANENPAHPSPTGGRRLIVRTGRPHSRSPAGRAPPTDA